MTIKRDSNRDNAERSTHKRAPYVAPVLERFGSLSEMTLSNGGRGSDGFSQSVQTGS